MMTTHMREFNLDSIPPDITMQGPLTGDAVLQSYHCQAFQGFRVLDLVEEDVLRTGCIPNNHFIFLLNGAATVSLNHGESRTMSDGQMMLVTINMSLHLQCHRSCRILIHTFNALLPECEEQVNNMYKLNSNYSEQHTPILPLHPLIKQFGQSVYELVKYRKMTPWITRLKRLEIFSLITLTQDVDNVLSFFYPLLNKQYSFRSIVLANTNATATVDDLQKASGLCRTNFYRRFKREFGMPVGQWLKMRKAFAIRESAGFPGMNVKTLMAEYGFTCPVSFVRFCQTYFGCMPNALIHDVRNGCLPNIVQTER